MTTKELLADVRKNIAEVEKSLSNNVAAQANTNLTISNLNLQMQSNERRFGQIAANFDKIRDSLKSLEVIAQTNLESITMLQKEWQAYLRRRPSN